MLSSQNLSILVVVFALSMAAMLLASITSLKLWQAWLVVYALYAIGLLDGLNT